MLCLMVLKVLPPQNILVKQDGTSAKVDEKLEFKVIEFSKVQRESFCHIQRF